jgi:hypothetical protein
MVSDLRAILVSVEFGDLLAISLAYNRHHFAEVMVVTTPADTITAAVAKQNKAAVFATMSFYDRGAVFNKWKALEEGLDVFGRYGWLCIMDADVLWPRRIPSFAKIVNNIYTPRRRIMADLSQPAFSAALQDELSWERFPLHKETEFAGFSQIFHGSDPHLGSPPWHEVNWRHAGGADSYFQRKWPSRHKVRPPFEVLHLGQDGLNWCGRVTQYLDGSVPLDAAAHDAQTQAFIRGRVHGSHRHVHEKLA